MFVPGGETLYSFIHLTETCWLHAKHLGEGDAQDG